MHIDSLTLTNFKSFRQATLSLAPGLTCIVGPNGCGKSNLIDAVRWALGERGPLALRVGGDDGLTGLVFAGTPGSGPGQGGAAAVPQPPAASAQVDVVLDNADRRLTLPIDQVELTRQVERDGQGTYRINRQDARARDVAATGAPRAVVVVAQGHITGMLLDGQAGLRRTVEDALDLTRHRANIVRAADRLAEGTSKFERMEGELKLLERDLKSVAQRAARAERYRALRDEVEGLRRGIALLRRHVLARRIADEEARMDKFDRKIAEASGHREKREAEHEQLGNELDQLLDGLAGVGWSEGLRLTDAILAALDAGDVAGARGLAQELQELARDRRRGGTAPPDRAGALRRKLKSLSTKLDKEREEGFSLARQREDLRREIAARRREHEALPPNDAGSGEIPTEDPQLLVEQERARSAELENFGRVDEGAIEEKRQVEERLRVVRAAYEDLKQARVMLERIIRRIRDRCRQILEEGLPASGRRFRELLRRLFGPGAAGDLRFGSPPSTDDFLWTRELAVDVQLPGKEVFPLVSISGGEQSLAALAFLVACWWGEAPPVLFIDEADAALDDTNAPKTAALLAELARRTQVVVITHNHATMTYADRLVGVSMDPPGVSCLLDVTYDVAMKEAAR